MAYSPVGSSGLQRPLARVLPEEEGVPGHFARSCWPAPRREPRATAALVAAGTAALALTGLVVVLALRAPSGGRAPERCAPLWGQCGGEGHSGPSCCEAGSICSPRPLHRLPTYQQCLSPESAENRSRQRLGNGTRCAELWGQCGGVGFAGPSCCRRGTCTPRPLPRLPSYRQCLKGVASSNRSNGSAEEPASSNETQCADLWGKCGGEGYAGPTCCKEGSVCTPNPLPELASNQQCLTVEATFNHSKNITTGTAKCAKLEGQCGGEGYLGPTCCEENATCAHRPLPQMPSHHKCLKMEAATANHLNRSAGAGKCVKFGAQCGGDGYKGPTCCEEDSLCMEKPLPSLASYRECANKTQEHTDGGRYAGKCAKLESQCGGEGYSGPTCCEDGSTCTEKPVPNQSSYWECVSVTHMEEDSQGQVGKCVELRGQCGGEGYDGPTCCEEGTTCTRQPNARLPSYQECSNDTQEHGDEEQDTGKCAKLGEPCGGEGFAGVRCCEKGLNCTHKPLPNRPSYHECSNKTRKHRRRKQGTGTCAKVGEQCGGVDHKGPTCCEGESNCMDKALPNDPSYQECLNKTQERDKSKQDAGECVKLGGQCGGEAYTGPTCCEEGSNCTRKPLSNRPSYLECSMESQQRDEPKQDDAGSCAKVGAPCGGEGYAGPMCCEEGSNCTHRPLPKHPSYHECSSKTQLEHDATKQGAGACIQLGGQCGGEGYTGAICCEQGSECMHKPLPKRASYHECSKKAELHDETKQAVEECVKVGGQCGGEGYAGPKCCEEGSTCTHKLLPSRPSYRECSNGTREHREGKQRARQCAKLGAQCGGEEYDGPTCCEENSNCTHKPLPSRPLYQECSNRTQEHREQGANECAKLHGQCGGEGYDGPTCCEEGSNCTRRPVGSLPSHQCTRLEKREDGKGKCAKLWGQCGGEGYDGPTCCEEGSTCIARALPNHPSYHQCSTEQFGAEACSAEDDNCASLWAQCGGEGYTGPSCCEEGTFCTHKPLPTLPSYHQCLDKEARANVSELASTAGPCAKLWEQCGGDDFSGPTCCEAGTECTKYPLAHLPSYQQCRNKVVACAEPAPGSQCYQTITWDMTAGIWNQPGSYHGLTAQSSFKEFQEFEHMLNFERSQCPAPCGPGTCFFIFRFEGCDTMNEWTCGKEDDSLAYACCCKYFHNENETSKPNKPSAELARAMEAAASSAPSLFCASLCMPRTYEVGLLRAQYQRGRLGLFGCNEWVVYSNESLRLSPKGEEPVVCTKVMNGSLSAVIGGQYKTALNTQVFLRFWEKIITNMKAWVCDWVVKLDPDTVFLPARLRALLHTKQGPLAAAEPDAGIYLNNCHVGLHGPIEVLSRRALGTYLAGRQRCATGRASEHGQEDWFLDVCFSDLGVLRLDAFNMLFEATLACQERPSSWHPYRPPCFAPQVAFHPFKSISSYMHCHVEAANHPWALPTEPIGEEPSDANEQHS